MSRNLASKLAALSETPAIILLCIFTATPGHLFSRISKTINRVHYLSNDGGVLSQSRLPAIKSQRTIQEIASHYGVHPNQVTRWKHEAIEGLAETFRDAM